jgi:hypothetical protein
MDRNQYDNAMKRLALMACLFLTIGCRASFGIISHVGSVSAAAGGLTTESVTRAAGSTSNLLLLICYVGHGVGTSLTASNTPNAFTWTQIQQVTSANNTFNAFWAIPTTTVSQTITCTQNGVAAFMSAGVDEFSGENPSAPIDVSSATSGVVGQCTTLSSMTANGEMGWSALEDSLTGASTINGYTAVLGVNDGSGDGTEYYNYDNAGFFQREFCERYFWRDGGGHVAVYHGGDFTEWSTVKFARQWFDAMKGKIMKKIIAVLLALMMPAVSWAAVQVIVLSVNDAGSNRITYNYLCWLNSPNALPNPGFVSAWKALGSSAGPNAAQMTALQNGTVTEQFANVTVSSATAIGSVENTMISDCNTRQSYINNIPGQGIFYGQTYNGTTWALQ